ncbi:MAG: CvpA family protein, partial [Ruminococcus sp.]|nr:CvpA family protein [Ruminococcus sp.]
IAQNGEEFAAKTSLQALPDGFERMLEGLSKLFGVSPETIQGRLMLAPSQTDGIAQAIEKPVSELCVFLLSVIVSIVIFALLWIIFKMIIRLVMPLFSLPGVHAVNKIFGGVLGALEGAVLAVFLCNILYVLISCTNPALTENATLFGSLFHALVFFK